MSIFQPERLKVVGLGVRRGRGGEGREEEGG